MTTTLATDTAPTRGEVAEALLWAIASHRPGDPAIEEALTLWVEVVGYEEGDVVEVTLPTGTTYAGIVTGLGSVDSVWGGGIWVEVAEDRPVRFAPLSWARPTVLDAAPRAFDLVEAADRAQR